MKWFGLLSRGRGHPIRPPAARPSALPPAGIDYLRAQAGLAQPTGSWPAAFGFEPSALDVRLSRETASLDTLRERAKQAEQRSNWDEAAAPAVFSLGRAPARGVRAVGKWPAGATVQSLAEAGHLSTAVVIADLR
jgi:hypothetical protein